MSESEINEMKWDDGKGLNEVNSDAIMSAIAHGEVIESQIFRISHDVEEVCAIRAIELALKAQRKELDRAYELLAYWADALSSGKVPDTE